MPPAPGDEGVLHRIMPEGGGCCLLFGRRSSGAASTTIKAVLIASELNDYRLNVVGVAQRGQPILSSSRKAVVHLRGVTIPKMI